MDLTSMFAPRSVVLIGASEKSLWSQLIFNNLIINPETDIFLVNKRGAPAHGREAVTCCADLPSVPDIAYLFVPTDAVLEATKDAAAAGIKHLILLTSGFSEAGETGKKLQQELYQTAQSYGMRILGPNSLGFTDFHRKLAITPVKFQPQVIPGNVAIVSQSGQIGSELTNHARQQAVGISYCIATGNEMDLDASTVMNFLLDDENTRAIAFFAEGIASPAEFIESAKKASAMGKAIVVLKVGSSPLASKLAEAHTGSVAGDDRVFRAVCRQYNVICVESLEELICTAGLLSHTGPIKGGVGITSISGGACEIIADRADALAMSLPQLTPETQSRITDHLPALAHGMNPLDITGAAVRDPLLFEKILQELSRDPNIGLTACVYTTPRDDNDFYHLSALKHIGNGLSSGTGKGILINSSIRPITELTLDIQKQANIPYIIGGLELAVRALAHLKEWSAAVKNSLPESTQIGPATAKPCGEKESLDYLSSCGINVLPQQLVTTAEQAAEFAASLDGPCVLKIASKDIAHKSDIGGVKLNLKGSEQVESAFADMMSSVKSAAPNAHLDGALISPMRPQGIELFVGIAKTQWGPALAVGIGGVWIELLQDTSLRLLPVDDATIQDMLAELQGYRLLTGYRGSAPCDLEKVASTIRMISESALALGDNLVSLEVNPLYVRDGLVEAMDALCLWED